MKWARRIGFPLSAIGLVLYAPPIARLLCTVWGQAGRLGTLIAFAVGWSLLLGDLAFYLGFNSGRE